MAEQSPVLLSFKEFAELIVKQRGIHEGLWGIHTRFGLTVANFNFESQDEPTVVQMRPAAIASLVEIGIRRFEKMNDLCVDAAIVNPRKPSKKKPTKKAKKSR